MYHDDDYDYDDCPGCGRRDYGWEMPDVRSTLYISHCRCKPACVCTDEERKDYDSEFQGCICQDNGCECDRSEVKVTIRRIFDRECNYCGGWDYRCVWDVSLDGTVVKTTESEADADAYVSRTFPTAEAPERDYAWESEAWLRRAEGWG
jgi:hypothetical protein